MKESFGRPFCLFRTRPGSIAVCLVCMHVLGRPSVWRGSWAAVVQPRYSGTASTIIVPACLGGAAGSLPFRTAASSGSPGRCSLEDRWSISAGRLHVGRTRCLVFLGPRPPPTCTGAAAGQRMMAHGQCCRRASRRRAHGPGINEARGILTDTHQLYQPPPFPGGTLPARLLITQPSNDPRPRLCVKSRLTGCLPSFGCDMMLLMQPHCWWCRPRRSLLMIGEVDNVHVRRSGLIRCLERHVSVYAAYQGMSHIFISVLHVGFFSASTTHPATLATRAGQLKRDAPIDSRPRPGLCPI